MVEKINYLLRRFDDTEWSGPAWYKITNAMKNGFPLKVELTHFIPVHLGESAETEIDGETLGKLLPKVYKKEGYAHLKDCFLGLIHSHHTMGAFFSGTDKDTALEQAPTQGIFFSTVVASAKKKFATGMSYCDQFVYSNFIEGKVKHHYKVKAQKQWIAEATAIQQQAKKEKKNKVTYYGGAYGQGSFFNSGTVQTNAYNSTSRYFKNGVEQNVKDSVKDTSMDDLDDVQSEKIAELYSKLEANELTDQQFIDECKKVAPDVDPHWFIDSMGNGFFI